MPDETASSGHPGPSRPHLSFADLRTIAHFLSPSRDRATLASLRLVSKDAYFAATPRLYREVLLAEHTSPVVTDIKIDEPGLHTVGNLADLIALAAEAKDDGSYFTSRRRSLRRLDALRHVEALVVDDPELRIFDLIYDLKQRELIPRYHPHTRALHPPELPLRNVFCTRLKRVSLGPTFCECLYEGGVTIWGPPHKLFDDVLELCQGTDIEDFCVVANTSGGWSFGHGLGDGDNLFQQALSRLPSIKRWTIHETRGRQNLPSEPGLEIRIGFAPLPDRDTGLISLLSLNQPDRPPSEWVCNRVADIGGERPTVITRMIQGCAADGRWELIRVDNGVYCGFPHEHSCPVPDATALEGRIRRWLVETYGEGLETDNVQERVRFLDSRHNAPSEDIGCSVCHRSLLQNEESDLRYKPTGMHVQ